MSSLMFERAVFKSDLCDQGITAAYLFRFVTGGDILQQPTSPQIDYMIQDLPALSLMIGQMTGQTRFAQPSVSPQKMLGVSI
jgi:hypothetical protein